MAKDWSKIGKHSAATGKRFEYRVRNAINAFGGDWSADRIMLSGHERYRSRSGDKPGDVRATFKGRDYWLEAKKSTKTDIITIKKEWLEQFNGLDGIAFAFLRSLIFVICEVQCKYDKLDTMLLRSYVNISNGAKQIRLKQEHQVPYLIKFKDDSRLWWVMSIGAWMAKVEISD